jgi:hypothetical protein
MEEFPQHLMSFPSRGFRVIRIAAGLRLGDERVDRRPGGRAVRDGDFAKVDECSLTPRDSCQPVEC